MAATPRFTPQWSADGIKSIREDNDTFRDAIHRFCVLTGCPPERDIEGQMDWLVEMAEFIGRRDDAGLFAEEEKT